jgi:hypothetical protein
VREARPPPLFDQRGTVLVLPARLFAVLAVVAGIAVGVLVSGLVSSGGPAGESPAQPAVSQKGLTVAVQGLCTAQASAANGDLAASRESFLNQAHVFLHSLAASVETQDREVATSLLVAMFRVEGLLSVPSGQTTIPALSLTPAQPGDMFASLLTTVRQAADLLGLSAPSC